MAARVAHVLAQYGKLALASSSKPNILVSGRWSRSISTIDINFQRYFTKDHEWIDVNNNIGTVGITDHAQTALGELVYIELPEVDAEHDIDDPVGTVESVKAASDVMTPVSGKITEVNDDLTETPSLMNKEPENDGWMFKISLRDTSELKSLFDEDGYKAFLKETEE